MPTKESPAHVQTALTLAVAEEALEFEHRDLHWGNLLVRRESAATVARYRLRWVPRTEASGPGIAAEALPCCC